MRRQHHRPVGTAARRVTFEDRIAQLFQPGTRAPTAQESTSDRQRRKYNRSNSTPHQGGQECARRRRQDARNGDPHHRSTKKWRRKMRTFAARLHAVPLANLTTGQYDAACEWIDRPENMHVDIVRWPQEFTA